MYEQGVLSSTIHQKIVNRIIISITLKVVFPKECDDYLTLACLVYFTHDGWEVLVEVLVMKLPEVAQMHHFLLTLRSFASVHPPTILL